MWNSLLATASCPVLPHSASTWSQLLPSCNLDSLAAVLGLGPSVSPAALLGPFPASALAHVFPACHASCPLPLAIADTFLGPGTMLSSSFVLSPWILTKPRSEQQLSCSSNGETDALKHVKLAAGGFDMLSKSDS